MTQKDGEGAIMDYTMLLPRARARTNEMEKIAPTYSEEKLRPLAETTYVHRHRRRLPSYLALEECEMLIWDFKKIESKLDIELGIFFQRPSFEENKKFRVKISEIFLPYKRIEEKGVEPWPTMIHWKVRHKPRLSRIPMPSRVERPLSWPVTSEELRRRLREYWGPEIASFLERVVVRL